MIRNLVLGLVLVSGSAAQADRLPVAVLWLGDAATLDEGRKTVEELNRGLDKAERARPIDGADDRVTLVEGGPATRAAQLVARAEQAFVQLKLADAVRDYETAESLLLSEVPFVVTQRKLGAVERNLLVCYDQLGRADDAARAAERLTWTAGSNEDVAPLLAKHLSSRAWQPAYAPLKVISDPPGVAVYRDLQPAGATPADVAGGDESVDVLDLDLPGYRRAHVVLGHSQPEMRVMMIKEDRLSVFVDEARAQAPDMPPGLVAQLGARVGAARVLVLMPDGPQTVVARWLDVRKQRWVEGAERVDLTAAHALEKLVNYVSPVEVKAAVAAAVAATVPPPAPKSDWKTRWGAWGKWYTWVAAGAVVALVAGLLIAEHVGDDNLSIAVKH